MVYVIYNRNVVVRNEWNKDEYLYRDFKRSVLIDCIRLLPRLDRI